MKELILHIYCRLDTRIRLLFTRRYKKLIGYEVRFNGREIRKRKHNKLGFAYCTTFVCPEGMNYYFVVTNKNTTSRQISISGNIHIKNGSIVFNAYKGASVFEERCIDKVYSFTLADPKFIDNTINVFKQIFPIKIPNEKEAISTACDQPPAKTAT